MLNNSTHMEQLNERVRTVEKYLNQIGTAGELQERIALLENSVCSTKNVLTVKEACRFLGISQYLLYRLTSTNEIPYYKPRGKSIYFSKAELENWMRQNPAKGNE